MAVGTGDLLVLLQVAPSLYHRINECGVTGCWNWMGGKSHGYGMAWVPELHRAVGVHRLTYELLAGPIGDGLHIDHLCRNRACCNPAHLDPVTLVENILRGEVGSNHRDKTHCPAGHAYDEANTYWRPDGARHCRACHRAAQLRYKTRKQDS